MGWSDVDIRMKCEIREKGKLEMGKQHSSQTHRKIFFLRSKWEIACVVRTATMSYLHGIRLQLRNASARAALPNESIGDDRPWKDKCKQTPTPTNLKIAIGWLTFFHSISLGPPPIQFRIAFYNTSSSFSFGMLYSQWFPCSFHFCWIVFFNLF